MNLKTISHQHDAISLRLPAGLGGGKETEKTVQYLHDHTVEQGYGPHDFRIYAGTGSADIAYPNLTPQIEGIKQAADLFQFSDNLAEERERDAFIPHSVRIMRIHSVKMQGNGKNIRGNQRFELR